MIFKRFLYPLVLSLFLFCTLASCKAELLNSFYKQDSKTNQQVTSGMQESTELDVDYTEDLATLRAKRDSIPMIPATGANKILVVLPLTGPHKNIGMQLKNGIIFAAERHSNRKITLEFLDENLKADMLTNYLIAHINSDVKAIIGPLFGANSKHVVDILFERDIPVFTLSNDAKLANTENLFLTGFNPDEQLNRIIKFANNQKQIYALFPANDYGTTLSLALSKFAEEYDIGKFETKFYTSDNATIKSSVESIANDLKTTRESNIRHSFSDTSLLIVDYEKKMEKIVSNIRDAGIIGYGVKYLGLNQFNDYGIFVATHLKNANFTSYYSEEKPSFYKAYETRFGNKPIELAVNIFDISNLVYDILERNDYNINYSDIYNESGFQGINGVFRFNQQNMIERSIAIMEYTGDGGINLVSQPEFVK